MEPGFQRQENAPSDIDAFGFVVELSKCPTTKLDETSQTRPTPCSAIQHFTYSTNGNVHDSICAFIPQ